MSSNSNVAPPTNPIRPLVSVIEFRISSQKALIRAHAWQCCLNCEHWSNDHTVKVEDKTKYVGFREESAGPLCLKWNMLPPPQVLVVGCQDYEDEIPF